MITKYLNLILKVSLVIVLTITYYFLFQLYKHGDFSGFKFIYYLFEGISIKFYIGLALFSIINIFLIVRLRQKLFFNIALLTLAIFILWKNDFFIKIHNGYNNYEIFQKNYNQTPITQSNKIDKFNYLKNQLIAHAGGEINGSVYTNSLEALNNSYRNGIRYFELDIRLSYDGYLIAMHDFKQWKEFTGYSKDRMPKLNEFMEYKILKKYTPLDMKAINEWFKVHKDAILVTDKIDNPSMLNKRFHFKDRLMMELFSINSVLEAKKLNIIAMPSGNLIDLLQYKGLRFFKNLGIKNIATSYNFDNKQLLREYLKWNIKVYIWGNYGKKIDNDYYFGRYINNTNLESNTFGKLLNP